MQPQSALSLPMAGTNLVINPDFEGSTPAWSATGAFGSVIDSDASRAHAGAGYAWLGGYDSANDVLYQDVTIAATATAAAFQFWYRIYTSESLGTAYDTLRVEVLSATDNTLLGTLRTYSNLDVTSGWVQSQSFDLAKYKGQKIRLKFTGRTDASDSSSFLIDDVTLLVQGGAAASGVATIVDSGSAAIFPGPRADYNLTLGADGSVTVVDRVGGGGVQVFTRARRLVFADVAVAVDLAGVAGQVYRLYQSSFNRVPDAGGLGFNMATMETAGLTYDQVAQEFIRSGEFSARYGNLSNSQFVTQLYANVLQRAPDAGGLAYHVGHLDGTNPDGARLARSVVLAQFSESTENQQRVLAAIRNGIEYVPYPAGLTCGPGEVLRAGACGVPAGGCTLPQVLQNGACVVPPPGVTVATVGSASAADASVVIAGRSGASVAYFADPGSRMPRQAAITSTTGKSARVYYGSDGALQKIVDQGSGEFISIKVRSDVLGADYLHFDATGKFLSGHTLYQDGSDWYTAPVQGDFGQFTGSFSGSVNGSFALKSPHLIYGTPTRVDDKVARVFNGAPVTTAALGLRLLGNLIPSAHAVGLTPKERGNLFSGLALMFMGSVIGGPANPAGALLLLGGAAQVYRGLTNVMDRGLDSLDTSARQIVEDRASNDLENGTDPMASMQTTAQGWISRGLDTIKDRVVKTVNRIAGHIPGLTTPVSVADATVPAKPLPFATRDKTPLVGTLVDDSNRIYTANGTIDADGEFTADGKSADNIGIKLTGTAKPSTPTVSKVCQQTTAQGQLAGNCTIASTSKVAALGVCQTSNQSGGNGTFSYAYNLGATDGSFTLSYDMYSIPDAMTVIGGGQVLFTTGGLVSGSRSMTLTYTGDSTAIVNMSAPRSGTAWTFTIGCGR